MPTHLKLWYKYSALVETTLVRLQHSVDGSDMANITLFTTGFLHPSDSCRTSSTNILWVFCGSRNVETTKSNQFCTPFTWTSFVLQRGCSRENKLKTWYFLPRSLTAQKNTKNQKMDGLIPPIFWRELLNSNFQLPWWTFTSMTLSKTMRHRTWWFVSFHHFAFWMVNHKDVFVEGAGSLLT